MNPSAHYTYNWRWVYNLAGYALHQTLTGHVVAFDAETGESFSTVGSGYGCRERRGGRG